MPNYETVGHHEGLWMPKVQFLLFFFRNWVCLMFALQLSNVGMLVLVMEWIHRCIVLALGGVCGLRSRALVGARHFG
jgi:hypothetical protein